MLFSCFQQGFTQSWTEDFRRVPEDRGMGSPGYLLLVSLATGGMSVAHAIGHLLLTLLASQEDSGQVVDSGLCGGEGMRRMWGGRGALPWWRLSPYYYRTSYGLSWTLAAWRDLLWTPRSVVPRPVTLFMVPSL